MNSEIQVVLTGNASDLQETLDSTTGSLDALGASADKTGAQVADSSAATDDATGSMAVLGDTAGTTSARLAEAGGAADASAADIDVASDAAKGGAFSFGALGDTIKSTILPLLGLFVAYEGIKDTIKDTADSTDQYDASEAQINQTLKDTNDSIGLTIQQINALADATSKNTVISTNQNLAVEQTLLGYSAINKTALPESINLVDDLATRMAKGATPSTQQLNTASKALGKALEDPATGMTAFTRATVTFTPAQVAAVKAMEAAGNTAGAQALEMQDLSDVVGGDASAATDTFSGKVTELKNSLEPLEITAGTDVHNALMTLGQDFVNELPAIESLVDSVGKFLKPAFEGLGKQLEAMKPTLKVLGDVFKPVAEVIGGVLVLAIKGLIEAITFLLRLINDASKYLLAHRDALDAVKVAAVGLVLAFMPFSVLLLALIGLITTFHKTIEQHLQTPIRIVKQVIDDLMPSIKALGSALIGALKGAFDAVWQAVDRLWNALNPALMDALKIVAIVVGVTLYAAIWVAINALRIIIDVVAGLVEALSDVVKWIADFIQWIGDAAVWVARFASAVASAIGSAITWFLKIQSDILGVFADAGQWLFNVGKDIIQGLINGVKSMADAAGNAVKDVGKGITDVAKKILGVFSPSVVFAEIGQNVGQGLIQGIQGTQSAVSNASGQLATAAITGATNVPTSSTPNAVAANNGSGGAGIVINVSGNLMELSGQDATNMMDIISRNSELASLGVTTLTPTGGGS